jgi:plastocyanin
MPGIRCAWLSALCLAAFATFASAQEVQGATEAINSTTPTSTQDEITIHTILVSNTTHYFTPNSINALPGDIVTFKFWPGNHSVIRAEYGYPCIPYEDLDGNENGGFYSGVQSPDEHDVESGNLPTWNLTINSTDPTFFYCGAPGSCVRWGMLGAINADAEHPIATQLELARDAAYALTPGQSLPADVKTSMQNLAETATATATSTESTSSSTSTTAASEPTDTSTSSGSGNSGLSTGSIVGIAVGGAALLALAGGLFYFFGRSKTLSEQLRHSRTPAAGNPGNGPNVDPNYGFGGMDSRHTSVLPPYAQVTPHYTTEGKPPSLTEADGNMIGVAIHFT